MDTTKTKGILLSKTFWASVVPIAVAIIQTVDYHWQTNIMGSHWVQIALTLAGIAGIYGRKTADTRIEGLI